MASTLKSSAISNLFAAEDQLIRKANSMGVEMARSPRSIEARLRDIDPMTLANIENSLIQLLRSFEVAESQGVDIWDDVEFFKLSMRELGLTYPSDFISKLAQDDIVEAYDMNRRQIFRNIRFMEISTYSLLEVLSYEWPMLFDRPSQITQAIIKQTEKDMWSENRTVDSEVPRHLIREILSQKAQVCEVEHRFFSPLYSGPNKAGGMLSVCRATTVVADATESKEKSLAFI